MAALRLRRFSLFVTLTLCLTCVARAQAGGGSIRMTGIVSELVALSIPQTTEAPGVLVNTSRGADNSVTVTLNGNTRGLTEVRIPVQIRSNTAYRLSAAATSSGSDLKSLFVVGARTTGTLATPDAAEALSVAAAFDGRNGDGFNLPNLSNLSELLSGPRATLGGTLQSPQNAVEVTLSVAVAPQSDAQSWTVELLLSAAPAAQLP
ncbi:MAG TPA: hypothetical protein VJ866_03050 [Pyrinomonadaceae bacterium]|nr:hypothetical protein [Pyrinomonadaceae bacterium]